MQTESFDQWKKKVNAEIAKRVGLSGDDLPDVDYYGMYQTGDSPADAAKYAIKYASQEYGIMES